MPTAALVCPSCRVSLTLAVNAGGRKVRCTSCGATFVPPALTRGLANEQALAELVSLWQRKRTEGQSAAPADLCRDRPELLPELERRVHALRRLDELAASPPGEATVGVETAVGPPSDICLRPPQAAEELGR